MVSNLLFLMLVLDICVLKPNLFPLFFLPNVLHVPTMKKNLISVSQLTRDHDLVTKFNSSSCLIKDKNTGEVLLKGYLKDGLYQLSSATNSAVPCASAQPCVLAQPIESNFASNSTSSFDCNVFHSNKCKRQLPFCSGLSPNVHLAETERMYNQWHAKLGHPSFNVLRFILNKIHLPWSHSNVSFCDSYKIGKLSQLSLADCPITAKKPLELIYSNLLSRLGNDKYATF